MPMRVFPKLPDSMRQRTLADLAVGECAEVACEAMTLTPSGVCVVDPLHPVTPSDGLPPFRLTVTRERSGRCVVDLRQVRGYKFAPRPIDEDRGYDYWQVKSFIEKEADDAGAKT